MGTVLVYLFPPLAMLPTDPLFSSRLANELLSADPNRAEAWVVMALYSEVRGEKEKAASFVDKVP